MTGAALSDVRQESLFVRLDRLADAVIWRISFQSRLVTVATALINLPDGRLPQFAGHTPNH
jgi:hypothetical protein